MDENTLIERYIDTDWPRPDQVRLKETGVEVWALIAYLYGANRGSKEQTARDYDIPLEAVNATLAYYQRYRAPIAARIVLNNPEMAA